MFQQLRQEPQPPPQAAAANLEDVYVQQPVSRSAIVVEEALWAMATAVSLFASIAIILLYKGLTIGEVLTLQAFR